MDPTATNEKLLLADIDRLRDQFPQTQDLYREVCILLFFRYGMTPTANKLYQLVHKGSMSAPAEALNKFWEDLREKSRVRIEHPDLPDALKVAAGDLTATLWSTAQAMAHETLAGYRSEAQAAVADANSGLESALAERDVGLKQLELALSAKDEALQRITTLEQKLGVMTATNSSLESQLQQARDDNADHQKRLEEARREFTAELEKLRSATQLADERFRAAEARALLEIDRERTESKKLQKELEAFRVAAEQAAARYSAEQSALQKQLGDLRQSTGVLEGNLQAVTANRDAAINEIKTVQSKLADAIAKATTLQVEAQNWQRDAEESRRLLSEAQFSTKPIRAPRRTKVV
jgi:chromosome segregation ATPase